MLYLTYAALVLVYCLPGFLITLATDKQGFSHHQRSEVLAIMFSAAAVTTLTLALIRNRGVGYRRNHLGLLLLLGLAATPAAAYYVNIFQSGIGTSDLLDKFFTPFCLVLVGWLFLRKGPGSRSALCLLPALVGYGFLFAFLIMRDHGTFGDYHARDRIFWGNLLLLPILGAAGSAVSITVGGMLEDGDVARVRPSLGRFWIILVRYGVMVPVVWSFVALDPTPSGPAGPPLDVASGLLGVGAGVALSTIGILILHIRKPENGGPFAISLLLLLTPCMNYLLASVFQFDDLLKKLGWTEQSVVFSFILCGLLVFRLLDRPPKK